jgi:integrase
VADPGQVGILLAHCPEAIRDLVTALPATGLRLGELLGLRVSDV